MTALGRKYEHREQSGTGLARGVVWATPPSLVMWGVVAAAGWVLATHVPWQVSAPILAVLAAWIGGAW